jgi:hypothetical protein
MLDAYHVMEREPNIQFCAIKFVKCNERQSNINKEVFKRTIKPKNVIYIFQKHIFCVPCYGPQESTY